MDKLEGSTKGTIVLATVYGDVHDINRSGQDRLEQQRLPLSDLGKQKFSEHHHRRHQEFGADAVD